MSRKSKMKKTICLEMKLAMLLGVLNLKAFDVLPQKQFSHTHTL